MKQLFFRLNAVVLMLLAFSFHSQGADKYVLEFNLEKGKTYKQHTVADVNMKMNAMGQATVIGTKTETVTAFKVTDRKNDIFDIRMSYQKMKISTDSPMGKMTIDSDDPDNSSNKEVANAIKSLAETPVDVQLTKEGNVVSVTGADKLAEKFGGGSAQMLQMSGLQLSEGAIKMEFERMSVYFPGKPVSTGDSWNTAKTISTGGFDVINKMTLTLKEVKDNIAVLEVNTTLETPEGGAVMSIQGTDAQITMKGEQSGTVQIDMKTGWVIGGEFTQKSTNSIAVMGQTIPQEIELKTTITAE